MNELSLNQSSSGLTYWLRHLARWALATVSMSVVVLVVFVAGIGFTPADNAFGAEYSELLQAVRTPTMHRIFTTFDTLGWLTMAVALLILARIFMNLTP
jgi:hypothetical protein